MPPAPEGPHEAQQAIPEEVKNALRRSGFPFQSRIFLEIGRGQTGGWEVIDTEWPWYDENSKRDRFLDIVASKDCRRLDGCVIRGLVEVKKTDRSIIFLRPVGYQHTGDQHNEFRCLITPGREEAKPATPRTFCATVLLEAPSLDCELCIVAKRSDRKEPTELLETDASLLVKAATEFAQAERIAARARPFDATVYVPIIVTTGKLYSARYRPNDVSLETGEFDEIPGEIREERWVRFTKAFTGSLGPRSVFVVYAPYLHELLYAIRLTSIRDKDAEELPLPAGEHLRDAIGGPIGPQIPPERR